MRGFSPRPRGTSPSPANTPPSMPRPDRVSSAGVSPRLSRLVSLLLLASIAMSLSGATSQAQVSTPPAKRFPMGRPGELKARLLDDPRAAEAPAWALEYAGLLEIDRLEP